MFGWWTDQILPCAVGVKGDFGIEDRCFNAISTALLEGTQLCMTSHTECFALICYENSRNRWVQLDKIKKQKKGKVQVFNTKGAM